MPTILEDTTKERIKAAAWEVFVEKGRDGARMQEIAERARANKAMIYYYFTSKDILFEEILRDIYRQIFHSALSEVLKQDVEPDILIKSLVETYMDFVAEHPHLPRVMACEIQTSNPIVAKVIKDVFKKGQFDLPKEFSAQLKKQARLGKIRKLDPEQTLISLLGMCLFSFIAKPIIFEFGNISEKDEAKFIKKRKQAIIDLLLNGMLPR